MALRKHVASPLLPQPFFWAGCSCEGERRVGRFTGHLDRQVGLDLALLREFLLRGAQSGRAVLSYCTDVGTGQRASLR